MARGERVIAQSADLVERGPGLRFDLVRHGTTRPAFVVRFEGVARAYENVCAHQAVELDWNPGLFFDVERTHLICSMHGALYEPDTGRCVAGPCVGASLARLPIAERMADGLVVLLEGDAGAPARDA